jgi:hypothetical protein
MAEQPPPSQQPRAPANKFVRLMSADGREFIVPIEVVRTANRAPLARARASAHCPPGLSLHAQANQSNTLRVMLHSASQFQERGAVIQLGDKAAAAAAPAPKGSEAGGEDEGGL